VARADMEHAGPALVGPHAVGSRIPYIRCTTTLEPSIFTASTAWPLPEGCRSHSAAVVPHLFSLLTRVANRRGSRILCERPTDAATPSSGVGRQSGPPRDAMGPESLADDGRGRS
jgi:hypothetical protein